MSQIKTLKEFREARTLMTPDEYNEMFGHQFETDPKHEFYDPELQMIVTYPCGSHIELLQNDCKIQYSLVIMRSDYKSNDLLLLEERLWDDFAKVEGYSLSGEEIENDYKERMHILLGKASIDNYEKSIHTFQKLLKFLS